MRSEYHSTVSAFLVCLPVNVVVETVLRQMSLHLSVSQQSLVLF